MSNSAISLGLGLGGGKSATSSGRAAGGGGGGSFANAFSCDFDGSNDQMRTGNTGIDPTTTNAYTIACWVNYDAFTSLSGPWSLMTKYNANDTHNPGFFSFSPSYVRTNSASNTEFYHNGASSTKVVTLTTTLSTGVWYHFLQCWDGSTMKVYFNGSLVGSQSVSDVKTHSPYNLFVGLGRGGNGSRLNGQVDEVSFWTSDQSSNIASIYGDGSGAPDLEDLSPIGWWRMGDTGTDGDAGVGTSVSTITDAGSGGNNLVQPTASAQPLLSSSVPS